MHRHILIEAVSPCVDAGRYASKAIVGEPCTVEADIFRDGHSHIRAALKWQRKGDAEFEEAPMRYFDNDRFRGEFPVKTGGVYLFTIEAWTDRFESWLEEFAKKAKAARQTSVDLREGVDLIKQTAMRASGHERGVLVEAVAKLDGSISGDASSVTGLAADDALEVLTAESLRNVMAELDEREDAVTFEPLLKVLACREKARFSTWYELFPRSETDDPARPATLRDAERRLPKLGAMGFDVVYLTPVHPIGVTNRKGKDDAAAALPGEPGSPWAIGSRSGGHTAIEPALGTLDDFDHFVATAEALGIEVALDFAIQCSPDHPWVAEHPDWFEHRADGSFRYAENPPFEYRDVYRIDFDTQDRVGLYTELYRVLVFWISHGVTIFRVDNPHTKPVTFWEWIISKVHASNPEVIFLAEAFTRPKVMKALAKAGFTQSYSYFTWRNEKRELEDYLVELTTSDMRDYFIPNFFTNTHDVLPEFLQNGGPAAFKLRLILAATLSPSYGIYSGYELCENLAVQGTEEYASSEKFEIKARNYDGPGNLNYLIQLLNRIRRENAALRTFTNIDFMKTDDENITVYLKSTPDKSNQLVIAVNLDPTTAHSCVAEVPPHKVGRSPGESYRVIDLLTGAEYTWGAQNYIRLDPTFLPAHILFLERPHEI